METYQNCVQHSNLCVHLWEHSFEHYFLITSDNNNTYKQYAGSYKCYLQSAVVTIMVVD